MMPVASMTSAVGQIVSAPYSLRWSSGTPDLISQASTCTGEMPNTNSKAMADSITDATPVKISVGADGSVNLFVGGEPVIVTGVFTGQQAAYEQQVIEQFCVLYLCERLLAGFALSLPDTMAMARKIRLMSERSGDPCDRFLKPTTIWGLGSVSCEL